MDNFLSLLLLSLTTSFIVTFFSLPWLGKLAFRLGIVDIPDGKIKLHEKVIPYLGGVGVYAGFLAALGAVFYCAPHVASYPIVFLVLGSTALLFIGLIDDKAAITPLQKIAGQLIAAFCFLKGGLFLKEQFFHDFFIVGVALSLFWLLTVINALNLVDVMDGLSSTIALGAGLSFFVLALLLGNMTLCWVLGAFCGALAAFLWYNWPPARMYLGDAGSLFMGGFLAALPFLLPWSLYNPYGYLTPCIVLAIPLLEVATLVVVRTYKGIPFYKASPDHFSIYLRKKGWSKKGVLYYVWSINLFLLLLSVVFVLNKISLPVFTLAATTMLMGWFFVLLF